MAADRPASPGGRQAHRPERVTRALAALAVSRTESLLLYPLAFGLLVCSRAHGISRTAMVPELLDPEGTRDQRDLVAVNGRMARVAALGGTAGALIGVGLDRLVGAGVLYAAALTFTAGTALALSLPRQAASRSTARAAMLSAAGVVFVQVEAPIDEAGVRESLRSRRSPLEE